MSEDDLDRVIIEENLKADHRDAKLEELVEKTTKYILALDLPFWTKNRQDKESKVKAQIRSLLQGKI